MNANIKKILIVSSGVLLFIIRIIGDIVLFSIDRNQILTQDSIWNFTTSMLIIGVAIMYYFEESKSDFNIKYDELIPFFDSTLTLSTFLCIIVIVLYFLIDTVFVPVKQNVNYVDFIIKTFIYLYLIIVSILNLGFSVKWIWSRRKKNTKETLIILAVSSIVYIIINSFNNKAFINETFQNVALFIISLFIIGITYYVPIKNNWVATLDKKSKIKFLLLSLINAAIGSILIISSTNNTMFIELNQYYSIASSIFSLSFLIFFVLNLRLFINILNMLPSTYLFTKKNQEINNLAFLIKYIAESINKDDKYILSTVTELAIKTSGAHGGWVEIYNDNYEINYYNNIDSTKLLELNKEKLTIDIFKDYHNVHLIESIYEDKIFSRISNYANQIKSLLIIPIYLFDNRKGSIVIFKNEEYSLDYDDVKVMSAFGDNLRIALENSELMKESIEKEKYKNEMMLAQQMQFKLLPQSLPEITNYNAAAISIPATVVGGDYYDVVKLKNDKYCVIIGDVSGKGITASFYMAQLKGIVLAKSKDATTATELLSGINEIIYQNVESKMFITMSVVVFDDFEGNLTIARAGHLPFIHKDNDKITLIKPSGIGVGLTNNNTFNQHLKEQKITLNSKSAIIMITDGVNELDTYNNIEFGFDPIIKLLENNTISNADLFIQNINNILQIYVNKELNHDDMTIFAIYKN